VRRDSAEENRRVRGEQEGKRRTGGRVENRRLGGEQEGERRTGWRGGVGCERRTGWRGG
jgi:hypothetical protein